MVLAVIPARYASVRFPGKPLADLAGESVIWRVYQRVSHCPAVDVTVVATDDRRIFDHLTALGAPVVMTRRDHRSGTDRVAEVAARYPDATTVVNVQGDEPFVRHDQLTAVIEPLARATQLSIATLATPVREEHALLSPHVVKVVRDDRDRALYFSRHAVPYLRDLPLGQWLARGVHFQHLGLYAFRASVLAELTRLPAGELEALESLEQLRWLAAGYRIHVGLTDRPTPGIDTPEDLRAAVAAFRAGNLT